MPLLGARNVREMLKEDDPVYRANMEVVKLMMRQSALYRNENKTNQRISEPQVAFQFGRAMNNFLSAVKELGNEIRANPLGSIVPRNLSGITSKYGELATYYNTFVKPIVSKNPFIKREFDSKINEILSVIDDNLTARLKTVNQYDNPLEKKAKEIFNYIYENLMSGTFGSNIPQTSIKYQDIEERQQPQPAQQQSVSQPFSVVRTIDDLKDKIIDMFRPILFKVYGIVEGNKNIDLLDENVNFIDDVDELMRYLANVLERDNYISDDDYDYLSINLNKLFNNFTRNPTFLQQMSSGEQSVSQPVIQPVAPASSQVVDEDVGEDEAEDEGEVVDGVVDEEEVPIQQPLQQQQQQQQQPSQPVVPEPRGSVQQSYAPGDIDKHASALASMGTSKEEKIRYVNNRILPTFGSLIDSDKEKIREILIRYGLTSADFPEILLPLQQQQQQQGETQFSDDEVRIAERIINSNKPPIKTRTKKTYTDMPKDNETIYIVSVGASWGKEPRTEYYIGRKIIPKKLEKLAIQKIQELSTSQATSSSASAPPFASVAVDGSVPSEGRLDIRQIPQLASDLQFRDTSRSAEVRSAVEASRPEVARRPMLDEETVYRLEDFYDIRTSKPDDESAIAEINRLYGYTNESLLQYLNNSEREIESLGQGKSQSLFHLRNVLEKIISSPPRTDTDEPRPPTPPARTTTPEPSSSSSSAPTSASASASASSATASERDLPYNAKLFMRALSNVMTEIKSMSPTELKNYLTKQKDRNSLSHKLEFYTTTATDDTSDDDIDRTVTIDLVSSISQYSKNIFDDIERGNLDDGITTRDSYFSILERKKRRYPIISFLITPIMDLLDYIISNTPKDKGEEKDGKGKPKKKKNDLSKLKSILRKLKK